MSIKLLATLLVTIANGNKCPAIKSCVGLKNGDYQSTKGCNVYATCSNGYLIDNRPCSANTVWDDISKRCESISRTCPCAEIPKLVTRARSMADTAKELNKDKCASITSCAGLPDGDYQSSKACNVYASCVAGRLIDNRPCAEDWLVWDDKVKRCEYTSETCPCANKPTQNPTESPTKAPTKSPTKAPIADTCASITSCVGLPDGDYQSSKGCNVYASCVAGRLIDNRPCAEDWLLWDDKVKRCEYTSDTCPCANADATEEISAFQIRLADTVTCPSIKSCTGLKDGNYQYYKSCNQYASCTAGSMTVMDCQNGADGKPLVWNNNQGGYTGFCDYTSPTCPCANADVTDNIPVLDTLDTSGICPSVSSCVGLPDANYQYTESCHQYLSCTAGKGTVMNCQNGADGKPLLYNNAQGGYTGYCDTTSTTCPCSNTME